MIFLDTGFYIALINPKDNYYRRAPEILNDLLDGVYGQLYTSHFVMAESATLTAIRTRNNKIAIDSIQDYFIGESQIAICLRSNEEVEHLAWELFCKVNDSNQNQPMSFVDCTNVKLAQQHRIGAIVSFDGHYKSWLQIVQ